MEEKRLRRRLKKHKRNSLKMRTRNIRTEEITELRKGISKKKKKKKTSKKRSNGKEEAKEKQKDVENSKRPLQSCKETKEEKKKKEIRIEKQTNNGRTNKKWKSKGLKWYGEWEEFCENY